MNFPKTVLICTCTHRKREHLFTKQTPNGPCTACECTAFVPEPVCRCGHGKKAHARGPCHEAYLDNCRAFEPAAERK